MNIQEQIKQYINSQPDTKQADIETLHNRILVLLPKSKLWFLDGRDEKGKVVTNPNIGYGVQTIKYADGRTKEFYQIGISAIPHAAKFSACWNSWKLCDNLDWSSFFRGID